MAKQQQKPTKKQFKSTKDVQKFLKSGGRSGAKSDFFKVLKRAAKSK